VIVSVIVLVLTLVLTLVVGSVVVVVVVVVVGSVVVVVVVVSVVVVGSVVVGSVVSVVVRVGADVGVIGVSDVAGGPDDGLEMRLANPHTISATTTAPIAPNATSATGLRCHGTGSSRGGPGGSPAPL
jgi:hypothetical protein